MAESIADSKPADGALLSVGSWRLLQPQLPRPVTGRTEAQASDATPSGYHKCPPHEALLGGVCIAADPPLSRER